MSSTCFEPEGSSSGRWLYMHLHAYVPYHNCMYNHLPEDEPSGFKHVEDIQIKN